MPAQPQPRPLEVAVGLSQPRPQQQLDPRRRAHAPSAVQERSAWYSSNMVSSHVPSAMVLRADEQGWERTQIAVQSTAMHGAASCMQQLPPPPPPPPLSWLLS